MANQWEPRPGAGHTQPSEQFRGGGGQLERHRSLRRVLLVLWPGWRTFVEYLVLAAVLFWVAVLAGGWPG